MWEAGGAQEVTPPLIENLMLREIELPKVTSEIVKLGLLPQNAGAYFNPLSSLRCL